MPKVTMEVEGVPALLGKLRGSYLYGDAWKQVLREAVEEGEELAHERVPRETGRLEAGITHRLDSGNPPEYGVVSDRAEAADGTRYPFVLNAGHLGSGKQGEMEVRLRYASGARKGRSTRGWFTGILKLLRPRVNQLIAIAEGKIERRWNA